jgi:hypothetical protein
MWMTDFFQRITVAHLWLITKGGCNISEQSQGKREGFYKERLPGETRAGRAWKRFNE